MTSPRSPAAAAGPVHVPDVEFKGFGEETLDFKLLAWVGSIDVGRQAQNALRVSVLRKLYDAGIAIPAERAVGHIGTPGGMCPE